MANAPLVNYRSTRRVGLEIELDPSMGDFRRPNHDSNWRETPDGSLNAIGKDAGKEYVLDGPRALNTVLPILEKFCLAMQEARTNIGKRGGLHVHVSVPDHTPEQIAEVVLIYGHFQDAFDKLVGPSRVGNTYCKRMDYDTVAETVRRQKLNIRDLASRNAARYDDVERQVTVNTNNTRVATASARSLEFRQGSPSSSATVIYGWTAICVILTESVLDGMNGYESAKACPRTLRGLCDWLKKIAPGSRADAWAKWRKDYLSPSTTTLEQGLPMLMTALSQTGPAKLFTISRILDVSHPHAQALLNLGLQRGVVECINGEYLPGQRIAAQRELAEMEAFLPNS